MAFVPILAVNDLLDSMLPTIRPTGVRQLFDLTASQNNYDVGLNLAVPYNSLPISVVELRSSAVINITGIVPPTTSPTNRVLIVRNVGGFAITLKNADAGSIAANRFNCTTGADVVLAAGVNGAAGGYALLVYDPVGAWTVARFVGSGAFKFNLNNTADGFIFALDTAFWSCKNTGLDATAAANPTPCYYEYGLTKPTATYAATTDNELASIPIESGVDETIQVKRGLPFIYFLPTNTTGLIVKFRKNEQGMGLNKQGT